MKYYLLFILFIFTTCSIFSQADTSFWFVAPDLQEQHGDRPVFLRLSSLNNAALITISQPANTAFPIQTISLAANSSQSVDLTTWIDLIENKPVNTVLNKGLLVRSTTKVSCYYDIIHDFNGDIYALKGKNALGKKFTIPFQQALFSEGLPDYTATFEIVATADNTTITVLPRKNLMGHPAGIAFTIVLNKGQTYSCAAESDDPLNRPGGTVVTSDKPISISIKDDTIRFPAFGCGDTAGDQLIPDAIAGTEFVIIKGYLHVPDNYYVFATEDATVVKENGLVVTTINTGEYFRGILSTDACYVESSKPVQVFHISGFGCELGGAVIPSVKCTGSNTVSLTRATNQDFYINIITRPGSIAGFTLNGQTTIITAAQFQTVPGSGGAWMYAKILLNTSQVAPGGVAKIENNSGKFHVGLIHGDQISTCRYGFFSDFSNSSVQIINNLSPYCRGSNVAITAVSPGAVSFSWEGPNAYLSIGPELLINNFQPSRQGYYKVTVTGNICGTVTDSVFLGILYFTQLINASICQGQNYSGYTSNGTYIDTLIASNDCDTLRTIQLTVFPKPAPDLGADKNICSGDSLILYPGQFNSILWQDGSTQSHFIVKQHGLYSVTVTDNCGSASDEIMITESNCDIYFPTAFTPNNDGKNDVFKMLGGNNLKDFRFVVYNRWGEIVFETNDFAKGWDGKVKGKLQGNGVFAWYSEFNKPGNANKTKMKGTIMLLK